MATLIPSFDFYKKLESNLSFDIQRLEISYHEYDSNHPHRHNYYEILFFDNTGGEHEIDFNIFSVTARSIHLITPEQIHVLRRHKNVTGYVLAFSSELFLSIGKNIEFLDTIPLFQPVNPLPVVQLDATQSEHFLSMVCQIEQEFNSDHEDKKEMLALLLCRLLIFLKRNYGLAKIQQEGNRLTGQFKKLVKEHFIHLSSVSEYARMLSVTAGHLNDTVKQMTGKTAKAIITEQKILEAKRLLFHSNLSIKEIAFHLKYEEPSYFNRFFRKHTGITPLAFRQNIREKYH